MIGVRGLTIALIPIVGIGGACDAESISRGTKMSEEYDTECVQCCGYQDRIAELESGKTMLILFWRLDRRDKKIEKLEAAISELQCDESYCGIHGKCPQCKAKTLLGSKSI